MSWEDNVFEHADDPLTVSWFIEYWRITKCNVGCRGNYRLESRSFDHLAEGATEEEAQALFNKYVEQKRLSGEHSRMKGLTLFLTKVVAIAPIIDREGKAVNPND